MPARLTLLSVASPFESVIALPTLFPFSVKETDSPATPTELDASVADRLVVPPYVPVAAPAASVVAAALDVSRKQTATLDSVGVTELFVVERYALYSR